MAELPPAFGTAALSVPSRSSRRAPWTVCVSWQLRQPARQTGRGGGNLRCVVAAAEKISSATCGLACAESAQVWPALSWDAREVVAAGFEKKRQRGACHW